MKSPEISPLSIIFQLKHTPGFKKLQHINSIYFIRSLIFKVIQTHAKNLNKTFFFIAPRELQSMKFTAVHFKTRAGGTRHT